MTAKEKGQHVSESRTWRCSACGSATNIVPSGVFECYVCKEQGVMEPVINVKVNRKDIKWDDGKLKFRLILPRFEELIAEILTKGEANHPAIGGRPSWQLVEPEAYVDALKRHVNAALQGETLDKDMETNHWGHVATNAMFLWWFDQQEGRATNEKRD